MPNLKKEIKRLLVVLYIGMAISAWFIVAVPEARNVGFAYGALSLISFILLTRRVG